MSVDLKLLATAVGLAIGEALHVNPATAVALTTDLASVAEAVAGTEPDKIASTTTALAATLGDAANALPQNATFAYANKIVNEFAAAKADLEQGDAVVLAEIHVDGRDCLDVLVAKGGRAAAALGV